MSNMFRSTNSRDPEPRELAHRSNDGLEVTLFWHAGRDELTVCGSDHRLGVSFKIHPEHDLALDAYYHPYCYLTSGDISYEDYWVAA
jgi:hypothetical protein